MMRLGVRQWVYASGNFGKNILWGATEITLLYILTDLVGLAPAMAGVILLVSLVVDAVLDPVIGRLADHVRTCIGRYGPFLLLGAPLTGASFALLYAAPWLGLDDALSASALVVAFRAAYSLIDLPHNALLAAVATEGPARARLAGARFVFSSLASLTLALALAPLVASGFAPGALAVGGLAAGLASTVVMILAWAAVRREDVAAARTSAPPAPILPSLRAIWATSACRTAFAAGSLATLTLPLFNKSVLYLTVHVLERPGLAAPLLIAVTLGQLAGAPLFAAEAAREGTRPTLARAHGLVALGLAIGALAALGDAPVILVTAAVIFGVGAGGVYGLIWGLVADTADALQGRTGATAHGLVFALAVFGQKAALGVGVGLSGVALGLAGYEPGAPLAAPARAAVLVLGFAVPIVGAIACAAVLRESGPA